MGSGILWTSVDILIMYTDPNAIGFVEIYTPELDTVIVPRSYFHDSSDGRNPETLPTSDPSVVHPSNSKWHGQSQDVETPTQQRHSDISKKTSESSTDIETAFEPVQQPPSKQSDNPSTIEINNATTEIVPKIGPSNSRGGKNNTP